jgi:hypothetical protein
MGGWREFHLRILVTSRSTTVTLMCGFWKATTAAVGPPVEREESVLIGTGIGLTDCPKNSPAVEANRRVVWLLSSANYSRAATGYYKTQGSVHTDIASTNAADVADGDLVAVGLAGSAIEAQLLDRVENCFGERAHGDVVTEGHKRETKVSRSVQMQESRGFNEGMGIRE